MFYTSQDAQCPAERRGCFKVKRLIGVFLKYVTCCRCFVGGGAVFQPACSHVVLSGSSFFFSVTFSFVSLLNLKSVGTLSFKFTQVKFPEGVQCYPSRLKPGNQQRLSSEFRKRLACKQSLGHTWSFPRKALISPESLKSLSNLHVHFWHRAYLDKVLLRGGYVNQPHFVMSWTLQLWRSDARGVWTITIQEGTMHICLTLMWSSPAAPACIPELSISSEGIYFIQSCGSR